MTDRGESGEVPIESRHVAMMFVGDGREHCIGDQVAGGIAFVAKLVQQRKVPRARAYRHVVRLAVDGFDERERIVTGCGDWEDTPIGYQSQERRPHLYRDGERSVAIEQAIEPRTHGGVIWVVCAVCRKYDVHV